jgi:uncharacterized protein YggT (Ycf19 family)
MISFIFYWLCTIPIYMLLGTAILSWFVNPYTSNPNSFLYKLYALLSQLTEPLSRMGRRITSRFNTGPIDLSLFVVMIGLMIIRTIGMRILSLLF